MISESSCNHWDINHYQSLINHLHHQPESAWICMMPVPQVGWSSQPQDPPGKPNQPPLYRWNCGPFPWPERNLAPWKTKAGTKADVLNHTTRNLIQLGMVMQDTEITCTWDACPWTRAFRWPICWCSFGVPPFCITASLDGFETEKKIDLLGRLMVSQMSTIFHNHLSLQFVVFCMCGVSSANVGHVQVIIIRISVCSATLLSAGGCQRQRCAGRTAGETMLHLGMLRIHGKWCRDWSQSLFCVKNDGTKGV